MAAMKTFGVLPCACMINFLQSSELRKHSLVRLNDLLLTVRLFTAALPGQHSFTDFRLSSSAL
jgi:hypothetical protein